MHLYESTDVQHDAINSLHWPRTTVNNNVFISEHKPWIMKQEMKMIQSTSESLYAINDGSKKMWWHAHYAAPRVFHDIAPMAFSNG